MAKQDYYRTLGVSRLADEKEIKRAYRKLAKKYHPDTNQGDKAAEVKFKEVTEAYDVLGDPEKKKLYDQYGMAAFDGSMGADPGSAGAYGGAGPFSGGGWNPFGQGGAGPFSGDGKNPFSQGSFHSGYGDDGSYTQYYYSSDGGNMDDILREFFGGAFGGADRGFGDGFGSRNTSYGYRQGSGGGAGGNFRDGFRWGAGNDPYRYRQGSGSQRDIHAQVEITLEEAALGCDKLLHLSGTRQENLQVHIPAGIDEGQSIRLKGKGQPGSNGVPTGNLFLKVHIRDNPVYRRKGMDVYTTASVPFETASKGGEAYVQTLYGTVKCKIPAGTRSGGKIRLKNKGIVSMKNSGVHGDEYVTIQVQG